jgi:hypothetical protein
MYKVPGHDIRILAIITAWHWQYGTRHSILTCYILPTPSPGLGAVVTGIVPKMAIRFASFERYKAWLTPVNGTSSGLGIFVGMLYASVYAFALTDFDPSYPHPRILSVLLTPGDPVDHSFSPPPFYLL